jgi:TPR repeat protein
MLSRKVLYWSVVLGLAFAAPAFAATMDDVRLAIKEQRMFDAFQDLSDLAETGDPVAQYELAGFYHYGRVGPVNFDKARQWYERSAKQGNSDAMLGLAVIYGFGQGVPQDKQAAFRWLVIAGTQHLDAAGAEKVASTRDSLAAGLTPDQIEAALAEARAFTPRPEQAAAQ